MYLIMLQSGFHALDMPIAVLCSPDAPLTGEGFYGIIKGFLIRGRDFLTLTRDRGNQRLQCIIPARWGSARSKVGLLVEVRRGSSILEYVGT